ncbi:MAG: transcription elongation factor GreA [Pseudomonadota bacterium]
MRRIPMTASGAEALRKELERLKLVERPEIIQAIATAREFGDLKENGEYHAAKNHQSFLEGRIQEMEGKLAQAEIIDISKIPRTGRVVFGVIMVLVPADGEGETRRYQVVGDDEADIKAGRISVNSPIARAAIGKEVGDEILVKAPGGDLRYEIDQILYE